MSMVLTKPNIYIDGETYFGVQYDWSNLNEVIQSVMDNFEDINTKMCYNVVSYGISCTRAMIIFNTTTTYSRI